MKNRILFSLLLIGLFVSEAKAQENAPNGTIVDNVTLEDLSGNPATLPMWGEKNLLIFYVDPDHHKQNNDFTVEMEENHRAAGDNLYGLGILNLKDAPFIPNSIACSLAAKRTAKNGAVVLADKGRHLSTAWGLGDCNNYFVMLLISKEGELVYVHKGEYTEQEKEEFYRIIDPYR